MEFSFTTYEPKKRNRRKVVEPYVAVTKNGRIAFNKPATVLVENKPYCILAYDKENKAIGILPLEKQDPNAFVIRHTARGAYVGAKKFLKEIGLLPEWNIEEIIPLKAGDYIAIKLK